MRERLESFQLKPGRILNGKYIVEDRIGGGIEGEVYKVRDKKTGLHRAIKAFFPGNGDVEKSIARNARLLDRLKKCPIVIHYHHAESFRFRGQPIHYLVSEYVQGEPLSSFCERYPGKRMRPFAALHVVHALCKGLEVIHAAGEYHGDIHSDNVLVEPTGIFFDIKLVDFHDRGRAKAKEKLNDIYEVARLLYDITGGGAYYAKQPDILKDLCRGLRRDLIRRRFPTISHVTRYLETRDPQGPIV